MVHVIDIRHHQFNANTPPDNSHLSFIMPLSPSTDTYRSRIDKQESPWGELVYDYQPSKASYSQFINKPAGDNIERKEFINDNLISVEFYKNGEKIQSNHSLFVTAIPIATIVINTDNITCYSPYGSPLLVIKKIPKTDQIKGSIEHSRSSPTSVVN